jgi:integrase
LPDIRRKLYRGVWAAVWTEGGRTRRVSLRTRDPAEAARRFADLTAQIDRTGETVADIFAAYHAEKQRTTARADRIAVAWKALAPKFAPLRPDQITRELCRSHAAERRKRGRADATIAKEISILRAAMRWHDRRTTAEFWIPREAPPRERYLSREEFDRLAAACREPHLRLFAVLALATAGRTSALLELTWDRVHFDRGLIDLRAPGQGQRKGRAVVPMNDRARAALLEAREAAVSDYVIEYAGKKVERISKGFRAAAGRAGLGPDVTPHTLRHTSAVWMAENGVPMAEISQFLGHAGSKVTERVYARFSPDYLRKAARALD